MKVKQLIKILQNGDPEADIVVDTSSDYESYGKATAVKIGMLAHERWLSLKECREIGLKPDSILIK